MLILIQCYPAKVLFDSFNIDNSGLNPTKFQKICPAIVEQIESKACIEEGDKGEKEEVKQGKTQGKHLV